MPKVYSKMNGLDIIKYFRLVCLIILLPDMIFNFIYFAFQDLLCLRRNKYFLCSPSTLRRNTLDTVRHSNKGRILQAMRCQDFGLHHALHSLHRAPSGHLRNELCYIPCQQCFHPLLLQLRIITDFRLFPF